MMNVQDLAARLTGCQMGNEISRALAAEAKAAGLVVVFGGSDDCMEFRGAINDEMNCFGGGIAKVDKAGLLPDRAGIEDDYDLKTLFARQPFAVSIEALWDKGDGYSWTYSTAIPHTTFEVCEGTEPYCRGIVFALADIAAAA